MSNYTKLAAGENILLEKQNDVTFIHCTAAASPQKNLHSGFFQFKIEQAENSFLRAVISRCVFRMNGKYKQIDDYVISSYYGIYNMIFLKLDSDIEKCCFWHEVYNKEEDINYHFEDSNYILLYKLVVRNNRMNVETFAAGGLIDTVFAGEGFLYQLRDGGIHSTVCRFDSGDHNEFSDGMGYVYIPCFNPAKNEGVNLNVPIKGGALAIGKDEKYYVVQTTGFPSSWDYSYTVKINPEKIYI